MALEAMQESTEDAMCRMLKTLAVSCIVTPDQMQRVSGIRPNILQHLTQAKRMITSQGFFRVYEDLPDICIDVPAAYSLLERFVNRAQRYGFISEEIVRQLPVR